MTLIAGCLVFLGVVLCAVTVVALVQYRQPESPLWGFLFFHSIYILISALFARPRPTSTVFLVNGLIEIIFGVWGTLALEVCMTQHLRDLGEMHTFFAYSVFCLSWFFGCIIE